MGRTATHRSFRHPADIAVIGGAGHVGLPLSLVFASRGNRVVIYDNNLGSLDMIRGGTMPFMERGAQPLLEDMLRRRRLLPTSDRRDLDGVPVVIITLGTPIDEHLNPKLKEMERSLDPLLPYLSRSRLVVLRSTVYPGTTQWLDHFLKRRGIRAAVAFCPERIVEGLAIEELQKLAQIVGGTTPRAEKLAARVFSRIAPEIVRMRPMEAELAKLFCNSYRYIQFAVANQFHMIADSAGLDYRRILQGIKQHYDRAKDVPGVGFAAGPCLLKDTMQLAAFYNNNFSLGHAAMAVNEGLPNFIIEGLRRRRDLKRTRVGILGMAFKADIDDNRDSLSYKLGKILRFHGAAVSYSDEFAQDPTFVSKEKLIRSCDIVVIGAPHSAYRGLAIPKRVEVVDLWGVTKPAEAPRTARVRRKAK